MGLALESYDIAGGYRHRYRAVGDLGEPVKGFGKNGHAFQFRLAKTADSGGQMADGTPFGDIHDMKAILLKNPRQIARNILSQWIIYATGAPVSFSDRKEVESMLDQFMQEKYGIKSLLHALVQSSLFRNK